MRYIRPHRKAGECSSARHCHHNILFDVFYLILSHLYGNIQQGFTLVIKKLAWFSVIIALGCCKSWHDSSYSLVESNYGTQNDSTDHSIISRFYFPGEATGNCFSSSCQLKAFSWTVRGMLGTTIYSSEMRASNGEPRLHRAGLEQPY